MAQVKEAMGPDAVILHQKKYREGGILGYGGSEVVEVTAAIEDQEENLQPRRPKTQPAATPQPVKQPAPQPRQVLNQYKTSGTAAAVQQLEQPAPVTPQSATLAPQPSPVAPPAFAQPPAAAQPAVSAYAQPAAPIVTIPPAQQPAAAPVKSEDQEKINRLESELAQMKAMLAQVMNKETGSDQVTLLDALQRQEVSEDIRKGLAAQAQAGETLLDCRDPKAQDVLSHFLARHMHFAKGIDLQQGKKPRTVALIGPTGVGKTTTLAKIAARFVLATNVNAALITADTYRISAVEQLKTYSDIIGIPLTIVYAPDELRVALHKYADKDLILIDTAGRSQHNTYQMQELQEFLQAAPHIEKHLVLSATTKQQDAQDILTKFAVCQPDRVIFTKADETSSVGLILNLLYEQEIALSFLTNGQSVPDDIVPATPAALAGLLLRE